MKFVVANLEALKAELAELPEADLGNQEVGKKEAVRFLASEIGRLRKKRYTLEQIAEILGKRGVPVSGAALKEYLRPKSGGGGNSAGKASAGAGGQKRVAARPAAGTPDNDPTGKAPVVPGVARRG